MGEYLVVCIGRQFGSGGHEIGSALAKELHLPLYDKELLKKAAADSGIVEELFEKADEKAVNSFLYASTMGVQAAVGSFANYDDYLTNDKLFRLQSNAIKEIAAAGPCVIIGRCADYILRTSPRRLSVFIHAPLELRVQRIAKLYNIEEDAARSMIKKTDKNRANYYSFYADGDWGAAATYDLCLNAGKLGIEKSVQMLKGACEQLTFE